MIFIFKRLQPVEFLVMEMSDSVIKKVKQLFQKFRKKIKQFLREDVANNWVKSYN